MEAAAFDADTDYVSGLMPDMEEIKKEEPQDEDIEVSELDYMLESNAMFNLSDYFCYHQSNTSTM